MNGESSLLRNRFYVKIKPDDPFEYGPYLIVFTSITTFSCLSLLGCLVRVWRIEYTMLLFSFWSVLFKDVVHDAIDYLDRHWKNCEQKNSSKEIHGKCVRFVWMITKREPNYVYFLVSMVCYLLCQWTSFPNNFSVPAYHMKCIDPWLIENRRQCPVCKRYVFPEERPSDEEENNVHEPTRVITERTPLITSNIITDDQPSRNQPINSKISVMKDFSRANNFFVI